MKRFLASIANIKWHGNAFPFNRPFAVVVLSAGFFPLNEPEMNL